MQLDKTQSGVAKGMALALLLAVAVFLVAGTVLPNNTAYDLQSRLSVATLSALAPALMLLVCIARLAKHRFFTPEDIHGSAQTSGTQQAQVLQSLLQNTLEQASLAWPAYIAVALFAPGRLLMLVPAAAAMFLIGRMHFFIGYAKGAPARAFGFAFTFYPTAILLLLAVALACRNFV